MKLVEQKHQVLKGNTPARHIERIARVCYKSEDKISADESSAFRLISSLYKNGHLAMMEHYRFILEVQKPVFKLLESVETPYVRMTHIHNRYLISFSIRGLLEMPDYANADTHDTLPRSIDILRDNIIAYLSGKYGYKLFGIDYQVTQDTIWFNEIPNDRSKMTAEEWMVHGWMSVLFTTNRGITHELVRHRPCSFAQESTRYCNYGGNDIYFCTATSEFKSGSSYKEWVDAMSKAETAYNNLINMGVAPQIARGVLPTDVKADIVLTANVEEWLHIFELRVVGTTGKPHPYMVKLMEKLFTECIPNWYIKSTEDKSLVIGGDWAYYE